MDTRNQHKILHPRESRGYVFCKSEPLVLHVEDRWHNVFEIVHLNYLLAQSTKSDDWHIRIPSKVYNTVWDTPFKDSFCLSMFLGRDPASSFSC